MENAILSALAADGAVVVTLVGEIDFSNADEVASTIRDAIAEWSPRAVRVDLREAAFIDSTGLGALIEGYRAALESDIEFTVAHPSETFRRVLDVTGLSDFFGLDEAEADETGFDATGFDEAGKEAAASGATGA